MSLLEATERYNLPEMILKYREERSKIFNLQPTDANAASHVLAAGLVQTRNPSDIAQVRDLISRFGSRRGALDLNDNTRLEIADGIVAFQTGQFDVAVQRFSVAQQFAERSGHPFLYPVALYHLARSYHKSGSDGKALSVIMEAKALLPAQANKLLVALIQNTQAWILFLQGKVDEATKILGEASKVVTAAGDVIEVCNVLAFEARILRQKGNYWGAVLRYRDAILRYEEHHLQSHQGYARSHTQMAYALILHVRNLLQSQKKNSSTDGCELMLIQAAESLRIAQNVGERESFPRVCDRVRLYRAVLYYEFDEYLKPPHAGAALSEARGAFRIAAETRDGTIMVHALVTEAKMTEDATVALGLAKKAHAIAFSGTDNRRVQVRANICLARVYLRPGVRNIAEAKRLLVEAKKGMRPSDGDYLADELGDLEADLACPSGVPTARIVLDVDNIPVIGMKAWLHDAQLKALDSFAARFGHNIARLSKLTGLDRRVIREYFRERPGTSPVETCPPPSTPTSGAGEFDRWSAT